jgi:hypothetical protein
MRQFFSCCLLSEFFHGDGTVRHFFLFVFCQYDEGSVEMGQRNNFFCCLFVIIRKLSLL